VFWTILVELSAFVGRGQNFLMELGGSGGGEY
jgi:hypothetical protein